MAEQQRDRGLNEGPENRNGGSATVPDVAQQLEVEYIPPPEPLPDELSGRKLRRRALRSSRCSASSG